MTPIITLIVSFSIAVLLGVAVYYLRKNYTATIDSWPFYQTMIEMLMEINGGLAEEWAARENLIKEATDTNKKLTELNAFMKTTFKDFSDNTKDVIEMKKMVPMTTKIIGMDGLEHVVPVDQGY